jgi:hypothetical protein
MRRIPFVAAGLTLAVLSCSDSTGSSNSDIPKDGYKPVPAPASGPLRPAVALDPSEVTRSGRVRVSIGGLLDPASSEPITYEIDNLTLVEDGIVKGYKIVRAGEGVAFRADIALIIDNTGSMAPAIAGVRASVLQFVDSLRIGGFDVAVGAIAYNDGFSAKSSNPLHTVGLHNSITTATDTVASAGVYGYINLTKQLGTADPLYEFINTLPATGGGDAPELALNALDFARRAFTWRPGAQRIYIVISDITTWGKDAPAGLQKGIGPAFPWTDVTMANALKADGAVVHCLCPAGTGSLGTGIYHLRPLAELTGGTWVNFALGNFSLTSLPIIGITRSSIVAEFVRGGSSRRSRTLRVVVELLNPDGTRRADGETVYIIEY